MTESIAGLPFWDIVFDADGDPDPTARAALLAEVQARGITDLYVFTHGWNNDRGTARRLYDGFFGLLAGQLAANPSGTPGLAGVYWPSKRWSDEPTPDFRAAPATLPGDGAAAFAPGAEARADVAEPTLDDRTLADLLDTFPDGKAALERMAALLTGPPTRQAQAEFLAELKEFSARAGTPGDDGESEDGTTPAEPRMLAEDPTVLFAEYRDKLEDIGVEFAEGFAGGEAAFGVRLKGLWNGAKEALRGATYWEMKNRAGVVGRRGLGPLLGALAASAPGVRVHLIGHSFGARLVSYALDGLPAGVVTVKSVTLVEGAFSHFAFAQPLPFDAHRKGALAGRQSRIDGPLTVCFSSHDHAVGVFYPLASFTAGDDSSGLHKPSWRWGGMGADGAQGDGLFLDGIQAAGPGAHYRFGKGRILNIDTSDVVRSGGAPSGAHSDIVHPELTWIVLAASRS
jgi:hypothetical protein